MNKATVQRVHKDGSRNFIKPHVVTCHSLQGTSKDGIVLFQLDHRNAVKTWIKTAITRSRSLDSILIYGGPLPR